jgi:hypothetical protein
MKTTQWLAFLFGLGPFAAGCWSERPLYEVTTPDASPPSPGAAGATGASGAGGPTGGAAGSGGGQGLLGCDQFPAIVELYGCGIMGACHGGPDPAAGLALTKTAGPISDAEWKAKLVGVFPTGGGFGGTKSMCGSVGIPYLVAGSLPATGLFLDKLFRPTPLCGDAMPSIGGPLTTAEKDCIQRWANKLTTQ